MVFKKQEDPWKNIKPLNEPTRSGSEQYIGIDQCTGCTGWGRTPKSYIRSDDGVGFMSLICSLCGGSKKQV